MSTTDRKLSDWSRPDFSITVPDKPARYRDVETDLVVWWVQGFPAITFDTEKKALAASKARGALE